MPEKRAYKRLETDDEPRKRILDDDTLPWGCSRSYWRRELPKLSGEALDNTLLDIFEKQRKLVEVFP